jgi:chondroitin AC lyase
MVFYTSGEIEVSNKLKVKMDSQGMAMLKMDGEKIKELSVADPSRKLGKIMLTISGTYNSTGKGVKTIQDNSNSQTLILIDLPQGVYAGKSVTVKL